MMDEKVLRYCLIVTIVAAFIFGFAIGESKTNYKLQRKYDVLEAELLVYKKSPLVPREVKAKATYAAIMAQ
jgi:hypothetical protein